MEYPSREQFYFVEETLFSQSDERNKITLTFLTGDVAAGGCLGVIANMKCRTAVTCLLPCCTGLLAYKVLIHFRLLIILKPNKVLSWNKHTFKDYLTELFHHISLPLLLRTCPAGIRTQFDVLPHTNKNVWVKDLIVS